VIPVGFGADTSPPYNGSAAISKPHYLLANDQKTRAERMIMMEIYSLLVAIIIPQ